MKETPQMKVIKENMKPGVISLNGFLGEDSRTLEDIILKDQGTVRRLGLTHKDIAAKMQYFKDEGRKGLGDFVSIEPHFEVQTQSVRGKMPCPFGHPGIIQKLNITVRNKEIGEEITFTEMNIHMIDEHGFYEGKGSLFRIDPTVISRVLEISSTE
ncbi:MAG: hypothetical protein JEY99_05970 [Spirochaetales bacterium]|nr:hypothetical protein [Spirochaetales bacterium]